MDLDASAIDAEAPETTAPGEVTPQLREVYSPGDFETLRKRHQRTLRALKTLSLSNQTLVRAHDEGQLLQDVCDIAVQVGGYRMAWVGYGGAAEYVQMVASSGESGDYFNKVSQGGLPQGSPPDIAMRTRKAVVLNDIAADESLPPFKAVALAEGFRSAIILPLVLSDGERLGVFVIYADEVGSFDDDEVELLSELASDLVCGIEHIHVDRQREAAERELRATNRKLEQMLFDLVQSMGRIVEVRDPYTRGHEERVARLAARIAEEMGWLTAEIAAIEMTALVHDIGKLCVPSEILSKPGSLTDLERLLVQEHPQRGHDILSGIDFPWPVAQTVLQHHERLDGSGYPNQLAGEDILPSARLLAVADVVEAISSHRPYRASLGMDAALDELRERSAAYDAEVVSAVFALHSRGELSFLE